MKKSEVRHSRLMRSLQYVVAVLGLLILGKFAAAQTVVNSTYTGQCQQVYSDPNCWSPPEVPANTPSRQYNVTIPDQNTIFVERSATVSNLDLAGYAYFANITFVVTGSTVIPVDGFFHVIINADTGSSLFNAGTLSTFSGNTLHGSYIVASYSAAPATFQFNGADIMTITDGVLYLAGAPATITDEFGNDGLRNFGRIDSSGVLNLGAHNLTVATPFTNDGTLVVGYSGDATIFAATSSLTNFDPGDRTLRGGKFIIGYGFTSPFQPQELRFNGADIVNNGSDIELGGALSRMADLAGNDGMRNLARNLPGAALRLRVRDFATLGAFRNDGLLSLRRSIFAVTGPLNNFDTATGTIAGGTYEVSEQADFKFNGADIVHNAASIMLILEGKISDLAGNDALRHFTDNLAGGSFILGQDFTAPGNFTNAGHVETIGHFIAIPELPSVTGKFNVPAGFSYAQTAGTTLNNGELTADEVNILGGSLTGAGSIQGNLMVSNALVAPDHRAIIDGDLVLNSGSHLRLAIGIRNEVQTWQSITGKITLGGSLDVEISDQTFLATDAVVTLLQSEGPITGAFNNAPDRTRVPTIDGKGSFVIVYEANAVKLTQFRANPPPAQLLNISSRGFLSRGDDDPFHNRAVLIGGFIVTGQEPKKVALRGIGPSLAKSGVAPVLADPVLELHGAGGALILANDDWKDAQANEIIQNQLAPGDDRESVIVTTLVPASYTVVLKEKNGLGGNGLVEVYDISGSSTSKLANISTRGFTDSSNLLIGGIIAGGGQANAEIVVRAIGPQLRRVGIFNALDDPTLELRDNNGSLVAFNDDWALNDDFLPIYELAPDFSEESGMRLSLPGGNYTAIVRAKGNSGGLALVEFYDLRR
jgi:hypothetical protein